MFARRTMVVWIAFAVFYLFQLGGVCEAVESKQEGGTSRGMEKETNVIDGVGRLQWGKGMESTYMGALTVAMNAVGEDVTYDYLMGVSGAAFRLHFHQPGWCPSSPDATCGFDHSGPALRALGYTVRTIHSDQNKPEEVKQVREAVVQSIDDGRPVVAIDLIGSPDWGVIVGYSEGGDEFICRTYYDKTQEYSKAQKWPWVTMMIGQKNGAPPRRESVLESLGIAQEIANTEKYEDYASGFSAYECWIADLLDDSRYEGLAEGELNGMNHVNAWCYSSLGDARGSAVKYLRSVAGDFGVEGETHLTKAADIYEKITQKLIEGWKYAPFPWQLKDGERWTKEMRHAEAGILKEVLALEREAIDELEAAEKAIQSDKAPQGEAKKVIIGGVDTYRVIEPMVEGVRIILAHRGEKYSPAYIQGISGIAFQIAGICPCAPTCGSAMGPEDVIKLLGYDFERIPLSGEGIDPEKEVQKLVDRVKDEIRDGLPVLVWHAFTNAEWDVVYGFDDEEKQFLGRGSYAGNDKEYASADETRTAKCGDICDPLGAIIIGEKTGEFDARKAELAALRWAVDHAHSKRGEEQLGGDKWVFLEGLMAYDRWISDFRNPEKKREAGDSYCYGIFKSTHRAASDFLMEIAPKYPEAAEHLKKAGEHFKAEADVLDSGADLLWWNAPQGPDAERNARAVELLSKARESYASGIQEIDKALMVYDSHQYTGMRKLDNLDFVPRATSHIGALEGCLKYLGIEVSPGWLFGSTGHAFIMNIGDDLCPSGPHCWNWSTVNKLGKNIGYEAKGIYITANREDLSQKQEEARDFVRKSIDDGFPCYGWHYEFMVINGYDDNGYLLSGPMDNVPGDWQKFGIDAVGFLDIWSIRPGQKADDKTTIKDALSFAVSFIEESADSQDAGLSGYDNWIKGLESGKCSPDGGAYHAAIWAECRRFAAEFLEEASQRTGKEYDSLFKPAIEKYKLVSENLDEVEKLFPLKGKTEEELRKNIEDAEKRRKAVKHLKAAKTSEEEGVKLLDKIVEAMQTDEQTVIQDVDHYRILEPQFECVRIALNHRGESYSPAYIQGISGAAFRIAGICPCAPTCSFAMETTELISLLGYEFEHLKLYGEGIDQAKEVYNVVSRVKEEIRSGRPAIVWHAFTDYEWDVVCGFDEEKKQLLGYGSYRGNDGKLASEDETRMAKELPIGAIIIGEKTGKFDARPAELSALREAVRHARDRTETHKDGFPDLEGLRAYDRWVEKFQKSDSQWSGGDSYCYYIYRATHRAASDFLREIAPGHGEAKDILLAAADSFKAEADALDSAERLIKADPPLADAQRNAKLWPILAKARDNYVAAIGQIEKALTAEEMQK